MRFVLVYLDRSSRLIIFVMKIFLLLLVIVIVTYTGFDFFLILAFHDQKFKKIMMKFFLINIMVKTAESAENG